MKRIFSLLLCLLIVLSTIFASGCGTEDDSTDNSDTVSSLSDGFEYLDSLGAPSFDENEDFVIYQFGTATIAQGVDFTEPTGERICDSVYWRNLEIKDKYGVNIVYAGQCKESTAIAGQTTQFIMNQTLAQADQIDLWEFSVVNARQLMYGGEYFLPLNELKYVDMEKDWWSTNANNHFKINGKIFVATGDVSLSYYGMPYSIAFNKEIANEVGINNLYGKSIYDLVRDGEWSYEKMLTMSEAAVKDENGDGEIKPVDDRYGFQYDMGCAYAFLTSLGLNFSTVKDGLPKVDMISERMINAAEWIRYNLGAESIHAIGGYTKDTDITAIFADGRSLFTSAQIAHVASKFRNYKFDYGVVPMPKASDDQKKHYSYANIYFAAYVAVPSYSQKQDKTGFMLETMAYKSYDSVRETYIDECVINRANSADDAEMLRMAIDSVYYDLNLVMNFGNTADTYVKYIHGTIPEYTSAMKEIEATCDDQLQQYIDSFSK